MTVNVSDPAFREAFAADARAAGEACTQLFRRTGVDVVEVTADRPYIERLMRFFRERARRFR